MSTGAERCCILVLITCLAWSTASLGFTTDWVVVGNPGNPGTEFTYETLGSVAYSFWITECEVTNAQYTEFLNRADKYGLNPLGLFNPLMQSDPRGGISHDPGRQVGSKYAVRPNMGNKPVNYVSWFDAARFTNWVNNGQGSASTETGAYDLSTPTYDRSRTATVFLPSRNEWVKAGFYDPRKASEGGPTIRSHYWIYPTMSDTLPSDVTVDGMGNVINPGRNVANSSNSARWNGQVGNLATVGSTGSASYYGTYDQAGNVQEWTDGAITWCCGTPDAKGGNWTLSQAYNNISNLGNRAASTESNTIGFRIATVIPEPTAVVLLAGGCALLSRRWRSLHC